MNQYREQPPEWSRRGAGAGAGVGAGAGGGAGAEAGFGRRASWDDPVWADAEAAVGELCRVLDSVSQLGDFVGLRVVRNVVGRPVVRLGTVEADVARELARLIRAAAGQPRVDPTPTPVSLLPAPPPYYRATPVAADATLRPEPAPEWSVMPTIPPIGTSERRPL